MKKKLNVLTKLIILFSALVLALILAFIFKFWSAKISNDVANWGQFGDYFGMIINLAGTVALFILSYLVFRGQNERDKWEKKILELNDTPVLIFTADNNVYDKCVNVGKGAAHKIIIGKKAFNGNESIIKSYAIPPNGYLQIRWDNDPRELYAYYESITGNKYLVKFVDDINSHLINGENELSHNPHKATVDWLLNNAERHSGISLRMIKS